MPKEAKRLLVLDIDNDLFEKVKIKGAVVGKTRRTAQNSQLYRT